MGILSGIKKFGTVAQKTYAPNREQKLNKLAIKEAKKENDIKTAVNLYASKVGDKDRIKAFEKKVRIEADKPPKPIFENVDKAMATFDKAFGSAKPQKLPNINDNISKPVGYGTRYSKPKSLSDPFGKSF